MLKLKLESLNVESFETLAAPSLPRGTVHGNDRVEEPSFPNLCVISGDGDCTATPEACGDTNYLDCTFVCSDFASCQAC